MKKKLAVFFPGRRYGVDCPLLYYAESICREKGYDTLLYRVIGIRHRNPLFRCVLYQNIIEEARKKVKMHYNITKFLQFRYKCDNFEKKHKNCFSIFKK